MRIVWNVARQRWWWNAWRESTSTELWGFADAKEDALHAMTAAISRAGGRVAPIVDTPDRGRPDTTR